MFKDNFWCQFDAFAKPLKDFRIQTISGALVSIVSSCIILFLFVSELFAYMTPQTKQDIIVDINRGGKMAIHLDIAYLYVPCVLLNLDAMDTTGEQQIDVSHRIFKTRVDTSGNLLSEEMPHDVNTAAVIPRRAPDYCGSCYGAESADRKCCNTCKEIQLAYHEKRWVVTNVSVFQQCREENWHGEASKLSEEGCRIHGDLLVNKVAGSFHISPGSSFAADHVHIHDLQGIDMKKVNMTHRINTLSFGDIYPGQMNPLDALTMTVEESAQMFSYYLKLVPTIYTVLNSSTNTMVNVESNQYSVTWHSKSTVVSGNSRGVPGLFFNYEISPILVKISQEQKSFLHFLTNTCAIVGGVFTVASLVDAFIYQSTCVMRKRLSEHSR